MSLNSSSSSSDSPSSDSPFLSLSLDSTSTPTSTPTPTPTLTSTPTSKTKSTPTFISPSLQPSSLSSSTPSPALPILNSPTSTLASQSLSNSPSSPTPTTVFRTVTQGSGPTASVVVITQTALLPAPTDSSSSYLNTTHPSNQSSNSGKTAAIAIPSAIAGFVLLLIILFAIRSLIHRVAAARAADDIRWPDTVTSEGDRAALYPEPTRPSAGHGLGLADDSETINMAGTGAAGLRHGPSNATSLTHSDSTSAPASANHYLPFEYVPAPEFGYPYNGPPPPPPPPLLPIPGSFSAAAYPSQSVSSQIPTYPPDWRDPHHRPPHSNDPFPTSGPRTSYLNNSHPTTESSPEPDFGHSIFQHPSFNKPLPYHLAPQPSLNHYSNSLPTNHDSAPRQIHYAPYPHGSYAVEPESKDSPTKAASPDPPPSPTEIPASPEWKLAVNNPDTH